MYKTSIAVFFLVLFAFSFSQTNGIKDRKQAAAAFTRVKEFYDKASYVVDHAGEDSASGAAADAGYRQALTDLIQLQPSLAANQLDSLYFHSLVYTGIIYQYFDSLAKARRAYEEALLVSSRLPALPDSFTFQPLLFTGSICYQSGEFDSAFYFLKKAETIKARYTVKLEEEKRLYNLLGVLNYETGNLSQSKNYVEKAIEELNPESNSDLALLTNYQLNIASVLIRLERYPEAEQVLIQAAGRDIYPDEVNHKLGFICLRTNRYTEALRYFSKVRYTNNKKIIDLMLNKSEAFDKLNEPDSAALYLLNARSENLKWNGRRKTISHGIILRQEAESLQRKKEFLSALSLYQQSVIQFSNTFNDTAIAANPETFSGVFAYIDLFNVLSAKAEVCTELYRQANDTRHLEASFRAWQSAFRLADYVERTYNSDESRLFLGKIKHTVHSKPIDICLQLYELTRKSSYLEEAYLFDQRNKATVLSLSVQENEWKNQSGAVNDLVSEESRLKSSITRLSLKAAPMTDTVQQNELYNRIRDMEIELAGLQEKIAEKLGWQNSSTGHIPPVNELQKKLDPGTALLSYHLAPGELLVLMISANRFDYVKLPVKTDFFSDIESLKKSLHDVSPDERYAGSGPAGRLYHQLIGSLQPRLQQIRRLIIIPDDELHYLPFEALQDESGSYLVERYAVQYQFSTSLVNQAKPALNPAILAFAPFTKQDYKDSSGNTFSRLPASGQEVSQLKGQLYTDKDAVKTRFLQEANHYGIIHLATHASANNTDPMRSFIAFYPDQPDFKLYAREIYDLRLDSLQLIILSACETGTGQLIKGEGLMSLSRAFTYAGCPNIITSLWKAEDQATAFLTTRLYYYLSKKYTRDQALQQAKIDLLRNKDLDPRFRSPSYWAHLIFIGSYEPDHTSRNWWWIALAIIGGAIVYLVVGKKRALLKKKQGQTNY